MANRTVIKLRNTAKQLNDSAVTSDSRAAGEALVQKYSTAPTMISVGVAATNVVNAEDVFVADSLIQPVPSLVSSTLIYTGAAQAPVPSPYDDRFVTYTVTAQTNKGNNYTATFSLKKISNAIPNGVKWADNTTADKSFTWSIVEAPTTVVPTGGSANQVLSKNSGNTGLTWRTVAEVPTTGTTDYVLTKTSSSYGWAAAPSGLPTGGSNGQVVTKDSSATGGAKWANVPTELPSGGTVGQFLAKTSTGTAWQTVSVSSVPFVIGTAAEPPAGADTTKFYIDTSRRLWYYNTSTSTWLPIVGTWGAN